MKMIHEKTRKIIDFKPPTNEWQCWFMHDNHTFVKCEGTIKEIEKQLLELFKEDKYGMWGQLSHKSMLGYHVCGPDGKCAYTSHFENGLWPDDGYRIMFDIFDDFEGVPI